MMQKILKKSEKTINIFKVFVSVVKMIAYINLKTTLFMQVMLQNVQKLNEKIYQQGN